MTKQEEIREGIKELFSEDMLLCFWTHEKCPPSQQEFKQCQLDSDIKHEACMPCWNEWVDGLVEQVMQKLHSQGVVIKVDRELPISITYSKKAPVTIETTVISPNIKRMIKALNLVAVEPLIKEE